MDTAYSNIVQGIVDQSLPMLLGKPLPQISYAPGDEISASFSDNLDCSEPFVFTVTVVLPFSSGNQMLTNNQLAIVCEARKIRLDLDSSIDVCIKLIF